MLDLARHIVEIKSADFEPDQFEDRYENARVELFNQKREGEPSRTATKPGDIGNLINLIDALRKSLDDGSKANTARNAKQAKEVEGDRSARNAEVDSRKGPKASQSLPPRKRSGHLDSARLDSRDLSQQTRP